MAKTAEVRQALVELVQDSGEEMTYGFLFYVKNMEAQGDFVHSERMCSEIGILSEDVDLALDLLPLVVDQLSGVSVPEDLFPEDPHHEWGFFVKQLQDDDEQTFGELIDVQEKMAVVMTSINGLTEKRDEALKRYLCAKALFGYYRKEIEPLKRKLQEISRRYSRLSREDKAKHRAWFDTFRDRTQARLGRTWSFYHARNEWYQKFQEEKENMDSSMLAVLWNQWNLLREMCAGVVGEATYLWPKYFELVEDQDYLLWVGIDPEESDDQEVLNQSPSELYEEYAQSHLDEMKAYSLESSGSVFPFWKPRKEYYQDWITIQDKGQQELFEESQEDEEQYLQALLLSYEG